MLKRGVVILGVGRRGSSVVRGFNVLRSVIIFSCIREYTVSRFIAII